jgi:anti-anti-sigma factor
MENQGGWPDDQARTTVVSLPGEVTYNNATQVREELMAALEPGVTTVILDLTLTTFFDSAGLSNIAAARRLASAYLIELRVVVPPSSPLAGFFTSSGFDRVLVIYPTLRAALTASRAPREESRCGRGGAGRSDARPPAPGPARRVTEPRATGRGRAATSGPP